MRSHAATHCAGFQPRLPGVQTPAPAWTDEQMRQAHRDLRIAVAFEVAMRNQMLVICMRNFLEERRDHRIAPPATQPIDPPAWRSQRAAQHAMTSVIDANADIKRRAANDKDD